MTTTTETQRNITDILEDSISALEKVLSEEEIEEQIQEIVEGERWRRNERIASFTKRMESQWEEALQAIKLGESLEI